MATLERNGTGIELSFEEELLLPYILFLYLTQQQQQQQQQFPRAERFSVDDFFIEKFRAGKKKLINLWLLLLLLLLLLFVYLFI